MKDKRILFVTHRYLPAVSGAEVYLSGLASAVSKWSDVKVITLNVLKNRDYDSGGKPLPGKSVENGIKVERHQVTNFFMKDRIFRIMEENRILPYITGYMKVFSAGLSMAMPAAVKESDVVIAGAMPFTSVIWSAAVAAEKAKKKFILVPLTHLGPPKSRRFEYEYFSGECEKLYSKADAVIVLSAAEEEYFKSIGFKGDILRIEPFINSSGSPKKSERGGIRLFTMGYHNYEKGIETTLSVYETLKKRGRDVSLLVAGPVEEKYRKIVSGDRGITHVEFLDEDAKNAAFRKSDIFILPSIAESFGIASVEANAHGLPVIGAYCSGTSSIVKNGRNGFMIQFGDYISGALFAEHICDNKDVYERMSRESAEFASGFSKARFEEKTEKLKEIIK